jgi:hypothetical protein
VIEVRRAFGKLVRDETASFVSLDPSDWEGAMTTRKPKLNLLYTTDATYPWLQLQLAVVTPDNNSSQQHARRWQAARLSATPPTQLLDPAYFRKH